MAAPSRERRPARGAGAAIWQNCTLQTVALFAPLGYNLLKLKAARQKIFLLRAHREGRMLRSSRGARKVCAALAPLQAGHGRDQYPADTPRKRETRPLLEGEVKWDSVQTRLYSNVSARFLLPLYKKYADTAHSLWPYTQPAGHEREYAAGHTIRQRPTHMPWAAGPNAYGKTKAVCSGPKAFRIRENPSRMLRPKGHDAYGKRETRCSRNLERT